MIRSKRAMFWIAAALAFLLGLWGAVELALRSHWLEERLRSEVQTRIESAVGGEVTIGSLVFDRSSLTVTIQDLTARSSAEQPPFLNVPVMRVGLRIDSFWRGEASLQSMMLERPEIHIESREGSLVNLPARSGPAAKPFELGVRLVEVREAVLVWNDEPRRLSIRAEDVDLVAEGEAAGACVAIDLAASVATVRLNDDQLAGETGRVKGRVCPDHLEVAEAQLVIGGVRIQASGDVRNYADPVAELQVNAAGPVTALRAFIPEDVSPQGTFSFAAGVEWRVLAGAVDYQGEIAADGVRLSAFEREAPPGALSARVTGNVERLRLDDVQADVFDGSFRGFAVVDAPLGEPKVSLEGDVEGFRLRPLLESVAGQGGPDLRRAPWTAAVRAHVKAATAADGELTTELDIALEKYGERPLFGEVRARYQATAERIEVDALALRTDSSLLNADGTWTGGAADLRLLWQSDDDRDLEPMLALLGIDLAELPVELLGKARVQGTLEGRIAPRADRDFVFDGRLSAGAIRLLNYEWTSLETALLFRQDLLRIGDARLRDGEGTAELTIEAELEPGVPLEQKPLLGWMRARNLPAGKALAAGRLPNLLSGFIEADAAFSGTATNPDLRATASIRDGALAGQPFDLLRIEVESAGPTVRMNQLELIRGAGRLAGDGTYQRDTGALDVAIRGSDWGLDQLGRVFEKDWPLGGVASLDLRVQTNVRPGERPTEGLRAEGRWSIASASWSEHSFGDLGGSITTTGDTVTFDWKGTPLGGTFDGKASLQLVEDKITGSAAFQGFDAARVLRLAGLSLENVTGRLDGAFTFQGDPANPADLELEGAFQKAELVVSGLPGAAERYALYNPFPMRWAIRKQTLELEHMRLQGEGTDFEVDGDVALTSAGTMDVAAEGMLNLAVLETLRPGLEAEGNAVVNAAVRGTLDDPRVDGRLRIENASVRSSQFPNGLSALSGEVAFAGREMRVEELTALSGGGRLALTGTASFAGESPEYRFNVDVDRVRLRYPTNISSLIDGQIVLSGSSNRGLLAGEVIVRRAATNAQISLGALLAILREPTQTPARAPWLDNVQLNLHVASGPDFELETALVRNLEADLDLNLVGTAISPSLLGRMNISQGQVNFHGSRYTINRGEISFVNPFRLEPVLDFELETRIRGIDIGLILSGPARRLNMSYRSDPPLSISDLVNLVAVGRSPTLDPVLASQQRVQQQSLFQTGANSVFEHAIERPVSPGLQRFFGVSRLKVDPQAGGAEANPSARISTEQQITNDVTLIYTYDLSSAQQQTFRLEYTPDRRWTLLLTRDQNGLVGSDVLYKTRLP